MIVNNDFDLEVLSKVIHMCKIIIALRKQLYPLKEELVNTYCRCCTKCDRELMDYTYCSDCIVNTVLNAIVEVL